MSAIIKITVISLIILSNQLNAQILLTTRFENKIRNSPDLSSKTLTKIPEHRDVELIDFLPQGEHGGYFKVKFNGVIGYITKGSVNYDEAFYLAIQVRDGNAHQIYVNNKDKIDKLNKKKKSEEEMWANQKSRQATKTVVTSASESKKVIQMKKLPSGTFEVPCKVNGLELNFIFDTGASDVTLSLTEALFMLKNGYLSEVDIIGTQSYSIANGDITEGTIIRIKKLEFGGLTLYNVDASIIHESNAPLLLGQSAISRLGTIQIDPEKSTLTIISKK